VTTELAGLIIISRCVSLWLLDTLVIYICERVGRRHSRRRRQQKLACSLKSGMRRQEVSYCVPGIYCYMPQQKGPLRDSRLISTMISIFDRYKIYTCLINYLLRVLDGKKAASHYALSLAIFVNPFLPALRRNVSADQVFTNNADSGTGASCRMQSCQNRQQDNLIR